MQSGCGALHSRMSMVHALPIVMGQSRFLSAMQSLHGLDCVEPFSETNLAGIAPFLGARFQSAVLVL